MYMQTLIVAFWDVGTAWSGKLFHGLAELCLPKTITEVAKKISVSEDKQQLSAASVLSISLSNLMLIFVSTFFHVLDQSYWLLSAVLFKANIWFENLSF